MIMQNAMLNSYEISWLEKMLSSNFAQKDEIVNQINQADILREYTDYYLSIKFIVVCPAKNWAVRTGKVVATLVLLPAGELHISDGMTDSLYSFWAVSLLS